MKRCAALAILAGLFVGAGAGQAQVTIKLKERGEGEAALVKKNETTSSKVTVADGQGNVVLDQKEVKTEIVEYKETVFKRKPGKAVTKLQREYGKVQSGKDGALEDGALAGKTVLIEKVLDKFVFTYKDGEAVEGDAATALTKDFSKKSDSNAELEKLVLPTKAVKTGESWKIDMPKIVEELIKQGPMELDGAKSKGEGKLLKTYKKNGALYGEMLFKMVMPILTIGKGQQQLKFSDGAKIVMDMAFDVCIDGTSEAGTLKLKMLMVGTATVPAAPGTVATLNVSVDATQVQIDATKKK